MVSQSWEKFLVNARNSSFILLKRDRLAAAQTREAKSSRGWRVVYREEASSAGELTNVVQLTRARDTNCWIRNSSIRYIIAWLSLDGFLNH